MLHVSYRLESDFVLMTGYKTSCLVLQLTNKMLHRVFILLTILTFHKHPCSLLKLTADFTGNLVKFTTCLPTLHSAAQSETKSKKKKSILLS